MLHNVETWKVPSYLCGGNDRLSIRPFHNSMSHSSDWMIEGPFTLAAAGFVPACGFAKPAGRFLCLG